MSRVESNTVTVTCDWCGTTIVVAPGVIPDGWIQRRIEDRVEAENTGPVYVAVADYHSAECAASKAGDQFPLSQGSVAGPIETPPEHD